MLRFVAYYVGANLDVALSYRAAFAAKVFAFVVSDAMWVAFWWLYFERFPSVEGYGFRQVVIVWAIAATAFGMFGGVAAGADGAVVTGRVSHRGGERRPRCRRSGFVTARGEAQ